MDSGGAQGKEEDQQNLTVNGYGNFLLTHAHLTEDLITPLVLVALGNLLIIDNQDGSHQEQASQKNAQEQEPAVHGIEFRRLLLLAGRADAVFKLLAELEENGFGPLQLFRFRHGEIDLYPELLRTPFRIQGHDAVDCVLVRRDKEQPGFIGGNQGGAGVFDDLRNGIPDMEGQPGFA